MSKAQLIQIHDERQRRIALAVADQRLTSQEADFFKQAANFEYYMLRAKGLMTTGQAELAVPYRDFAHAAFFDLSLKANTLPHKTYSEVVGFCKGAVADLTYSLLKAGINQKAFETFEQNIEDHLSDSDGIFFR